MTGHLGELAALGTATCWAFTAVFFGAAGRRVGSRAVNIIRLVGALLLLTAFTWIVRGRPLPTDATAHAWLWLAISGLVGFCIGDLCLFRAFVLIGARLSSVLMALAPPLTAIIGWLVLGEGLTPFEVMGMTLTVVGVGLAVVDRAPPRPDEEAPRSSRDRVVGVMLGIGGAVGQAGGLVLSKLGMGDYDPFAATQIRVIAGIVGFGVLFSVLRLWRTVMAATRDTVAMAYTAGGAFFGPFLGVSLSLVAVQRAHAGIAASLMATTPVLIVPVVVLLGRERVSARGIVGAVVAVAGVVMLVS